MPDLPTITVTAAQATRIQEAIGDAAAYRRWLRESLIRDVSNAEAQASRAALEVDFGIADPA